MNDTAEHLAAVVRDRRLELGFTQEQAAGLAEHVSLPNWQAIEGAKRDNIRDRTARGICRALGWSPDSIERITDGLAPTITNTPTGDDRDELRQQLDDQARRLAAVEQRIVDDMRARDERIAALEQRLRHRQQ